MATKKYNPGFLTENELVESFQVRSREFRSMVETVRACTADSNTHMLVVGPRGSGKTTLLLRVAAELRRDHQLSRRFFPITFAEETYNVSTCGEFWLEVLNRLALQAPHRSTEPDLRLTFEDLRRVSDDQLLAGRCLGRILEFSEREGKRLVVLVENFNSIFSDLAHRNAGWQLRHTLQTEPGILLIASATSRFEAIDNPGEALYDFFQVRKLRPLDESECTDLWESIAATTPTRATIRSLQILTGGSPRLIAIVARFGASLSFDELMSNLLDLVDDHTEYFRSHLESLPRQQRRVFLSLAGLWKPATTKEIAAEARISTNQCSSQLKRLEEFGAVSVAGGSPRRMRYYLTERMFNIYYLLRLRGKTSDLVRALVRFMQSYYSLPQQVQIADEIARTIGEQESPKKSLAQDALKQLLKGIPDYLKFPLPRERGLSGRYESPARKHGRLPDSRELAWDYAIGLVVAGRFEEAIVACDGILRRHRASSHSDSSALVAKALAYKGTASMELGRYEAALEAFEDLDERFRHHQSAATLDSIAMALVNKGIALGRLDRIEEALESHNEVIRRYGTAKWKDATAPVACALFHAGLLLETNDRGDEAICAYERLLRRFGSYKEHAIATWVGKGHVNRAHVLSRLGRAEEALQAYLSFESRDSYGEIPGMEKCVAKALIGKAWTLEQLDRLQEALAACDNALERFESTADPDLLPVISQALLGKGSVLEKLDKSEKALLVYDELASRCSGTKDPTVVEVVATGLVSKGAILSKLRRMDEAAAAFDLAAARCSDVESRNLVEVAETALLDRALVEGASGNRTKAIQTATQVLERVPGPAPRKRMRALFIRAFWCLNGGDEPAGRRDIAKALRLLPECAADLARGIDWLIRYTGTLGNSHVLELIQASPAKDLMLPLTTALEQELGRQPRVAIEVAEVASDIRQRLKASMETRDPEPDEGLVS